MAVAPRPLRFGAKEKLAYAFGYLGVSLLTFAVSQWLQSYYVPTSGGAPLLPTAAAFGTALVLGRIIDGFADPLAGYLSDTARTPLGRRRPFLLLFGPLAGLCFALLFPRVGPGEHVPFWAFVGMLCAYYLTYTLAVTPYLALLPDLAAGGARLGITTYQTVFNFAGIAIAMLLGGQIRTNPLMAPILGAVGGFALMVP
ncbi:MAG TPA: MFS transporter, partial [bacterium]|nr:MFS transporter [bacterium]